ncbi:unnamed protein product [Soboliphyme baturini]|uniref:Transposase n=1 Tax=Soboliphyme baturini TaxID=241478 RepID=A0A183J5S5_9BILA|nr:unnamed protein product [Soboliphyme baturini]
MFLRFDGKWTEKIKAVRLEVAVRAVRASQDLRKGFNS